jgi:hypothetical protein
MRRWFICTAVALGLSACGGGGGSPSVPPAPTGASGPRTAAVTVRLVVPGATSANARVRRAQSISENTLGIQVVVYATSDRTTPLATTTADISPSSVNCESGANGSRSCNFAMQAPLGTEDFVVTTYDSLPAGFATAHQLGYGVTNQTITAGTVASVALTLSSVLAKIDLGLTPSSLHTLIPGTATLSVYALDGADDAIVSNAFIDQNGNPLTVNLAADSLNGSISLSTTSITAPVPSGVQLTYNGQANVTATTPVNVSASATSVTGSTVQLTAIYPTFTSISDANLNVNNPYHGGMVFDDQTGVYYSTPTNFGGISYYSGSGSAITDNYAAVGGQPIRGGIAAQGTTQLYAIAGSQEETFYAPPSSTIGPGPNSTPAPVPNGSAMAYSSNNTLWYASGSNLVGYAALGGSTTVVPLPANVSAGVTLDSSSNVWVVDNIDDQLVENPFDQSSTSLFALQSGGAPFDVLANANGIFVTDHGPNPAILQLTTAGAYVTAIQVPGGATPWYLMPDNAQPGIIWFDYLLSGEIGIGRMDTNVSPPVFSMATDVNGPNTGTQAGAIGVGSNGLVYLVFDTTQTLVQVSR